MTHLLDTSGVLANYFGEPGHLRVREIIRDPATDVGISVLTLYEVDARLTGAGLPSRDRLRVVEGYVALLDEVVPVTAEIATLATRLRMEATSRISTVDCLIAATALAKGAVLVHRDAHFESLPASRPAQEALPEKLL